MRRLPIVGLAISILLVPVAASASVPNPAVAKDLLGGAGPAAVSTAIGDVTGDGVPDLIVARGADAGPDAYTVAVFDGPLSDPLPTDPSFVVMPTARSDAYQVVVGDLNHDGFGDLAVADVNGVDGVGTPIPRIDVFLEPSGGGDIPATASDFMSPIPVFNLAVADMNGDGRDDLLFTRPNTNPIDVRLRTQLPGGGFAAATALLSDAPTSGLAVGDVNHDGLNDWALDGALSGSIPVFVQQPDHTFTESDVSLPPEITAVTGVVLTDLNMPDHGGLWLWRQAVVLRPELRGRFVLIASEPLPDPRAMDLFLESERFLLKPLSLDALWRLVEEALQGAPAVVKAGRTVRQSGRAGRVDGPS
jgi:hypothetical protein